MNLFISGVNGSGLINFLYACALIFKSSKMRTKTTSTTCSMTFNSGWGFVFSLLDISFLWWLPFRSRGFFYVIVVLEIRCYAEKWIFYWPGISLNNQRLDELAQRLMYGRNGRGIWKRFESGKCTSSISMIKGFGQPKTNSTPRGPGLKGTVHFIEAQQWNWVWVLVPQTDRKTTFTDLCCSAEVFRARRMDQNRPALSWIWSLRCLGIRVSNMGVKAPGFCSSSVT